jgi:hypothetical protein
MLTNSSPKVVGYITDVEGNWQYFERCVALSSVLQVFYLAFLHQCYLITSLMHDCSGRILIIPSLFSRMAAILFLGVMPVTNATEPSAL